jgi:hypothetical protein
MRVANDIPLGCPLRLTVTITNPVQTLKVRSTRETLKTSLFWTFLIMCTVRVFRQKFTLEDAIGSHACSLEALASV